MLQMLNLSGFQPNFFTCLQCDDELLPQVNYFSASEGGVFCPRCGEGQTGSRSKELEPLDADVLKILRFAQSRPWGEVRKFTIRPHLVRKAESLMQRYLMTVLEHQLRSVDFLRRLQNDPRFADSNG